MTSLFSDFYRSLDPDPGIRGRQFEHFVKWFLTADPEWSTQVDQVWLWHEYPDRWGADCGIDLVFRHGDRFYIVDWKSNWLGNRAEEYGPEVLRTAMVRQFYVLQYHLYAAALHAHLRLRVPGYRYETHFGGVYYVFLRGLDPARPELGVFRDRPAAGLIEQLSQSIFAPPTA